MRFSRSATNRPRISRSESIEVGSGMYGGHQILPSLFPSSPICFETCAYVSVHAGGHDGIADKVVKIRQ